ncbi:hypothetical protein ACFU6K_37000 [Kitasatospora sp. NPDC057512]|uniref:hypothetical protein n=1 Tax=Kitasatospora sp. NPDC057512 TaxID=3346154 RepID=UPI00369CB2A9
MRERWRIRPRAGRSGSTAFSATTTAIDEVRRIAQDRILRQMPLTEPCAGLRSVNRAWIAGSEIATLDWLKGRRHPPRGGATPASPAVRGPASAGGRPGVHAGRGGAADPRRRAAAGPGRAVGPRPGGAVPLGATRRRSRGPGDPAIRYECVVPVFRIGDPLTF